VPVTTETKTIKISKETYAKLSEIAGELQMRLKRPVSLNETVKYLINLKENGAKITDLAGSGAKHATSGEIKELLDKLREEDP